jgi:hypothetical protein
MASVLPLLPLPPLPTLPPLPSLLSQALVAFTIEFDNEAEHRLAHWTTGAGRSDGPRGATWLVSQVMWANVLQYVDDEGVRVDELMARVADQSALAEWAEAVALHHARP